MEGFLYPNEAEIQWSILIVLYPYITGLVAGAFIISALHQVFGIANLDKVARLSLLTALAFLLVAPLPLQAHLGRPERGIEIFITPQFRSAMAGFGYIWLFYFILLTTEVWLVFRKDIVAYANSSRGIWKTLYTALALGVLEIPEGAARLDEKIIKILAAIGIPAAAMLHGYVGFLFGSVKANPWWSTPLMPIIFLISAIVSGIALLMVLYAVVSWIKKEAIDQDCMDTMGKWLLGFLAVAVTVEGLEIISMLYESEESLEAITQLITRRLQISYLVIQLGFGSALPALALVVTQGANLKRQTKRLVQVAAASLILVGVFSMRWNVVIGGQLISKSLRGLNSYVPPIIDREGLIVAVPILVLPFIILATLLYVLPVWEDEAMAAGRPASTPRRTLRNPFPGRPTRPGSR
ncbi:MAG: NrfD/PsrC family molybdoenzyme membrane anchor subunit [Dehalococcoidia bacterium]|nr:NrfD/PsrC family molybdoenzyme membrane anchor subunit [Dehalococcoidia bacterium]